MQRRKSNAGAICAVLVIVAMVVGILIGILIGRTMKTEGTKQPETKAGETMPQTIPSDNGDHTETQATEPPVTETVDGSASEKGAVVLTVNGREVMMEEVNYYLYSMRDYYVELYGEEPWNTTMDDGRTVAEYAKEQLYEDIIKTQILDSKAEIYEVSLSAENSAQCADSAQQYVDKLGADICEQFGLNASAITKVYEDGELSTAVYNAILEKMSTDMKSDDAYGSMSAEEFEDAVTKAYSSLFDQWRESAEIETSDIWESIVVGSVG